MPLRVDQAERTENPSTRRCFLKLLGASAPGIALAGSVEAVRASAQSGSEELKAELQHMREQFDALDKKTKFLLRVVLAATGINIFF